ncbi:MAG: 4Fe-4S ferredoxin [Desulfurococcales archaeon ex4484_58]|nr:MAG: 4Fe-4S ferredoxin [Desulfurococcales archaeon ex4484_58]
MGKLGFIKILVIAGEAGRVTRRYPFKPETLVSEDFRGRIEFDETKCIGCGACVNACPPNALELVDKGDGTLLLKYFIGRCIFCWRCIDVCPTGAITGTRDFELATNDVSDLYEVVVHERAECSECGGKYSTIRQKEYVVEAVPITESYIDKCPDCRKNKLLRALERRRGGVYE